MKILNSEEEFNHYKSQLQLLTTWRTLDSGTPDKYPCIVTTREDRDDNGPNYFVHDFVYSAGKCDCGIEKWEFD
jgi:hypothetical protein